ncbi:MAG: extracellular solute-binding protein [Chloroflexi bacterium]|nr:extracellular solute-binding protein [Chloroflexota bacterium]
MNGTVHTVSVRRDTRRGHLASASCVAGVAAWLAACGSDAGTSAGQGQAAGCRSRIEYFCRLRVDQGVNPFILPAFASAHPNCALEVITVPSSELQSKLAASVVAGTPPAVVDLPPGWTKQLQAAGLLAAVDDLFKRDKLNKDDFSRGLWEQMSFLGKVWFMPGQQTNADFVLFWNKAHFREAGLNPDKGPETIAELETMLPKLTRQTGDEFQRIGMVPWDLYGHGNTIQAWGRAFGGVFFDEKKDELTFTHARIQRAVEWYTGWAKRLNAARVIAFRNSVAPQGVHWFGSGRFSIHTLVASAVAGVRRHDPTIEIGAGLMPGETPGKPGTVSVGGWAVGAVPSPKREEAWEFMRFFGASPEGTAAVAQYGDVPGWLKSPALAELSKDPLSKAFVDGLRRAEFPQLGFYMPGGWSANPMQDIVDGKRGVREVLEEINRDANQRHAEWKSRSK